LFYLRRTVADLADSCALYLHRRIVFQDRTREPPSSLALLPPVSWYLGYVWVPFHPKARRVQAPFLPCGVLAFFSLELCLCSWIFVFFSRGRLPLPTLVVRALTPRSRTSLLFRLFGSCRSAAGSRALGDDGVYFSADDRDFRGFRLPSRLQRTPVVLRSLFTRGGARRSSFL